LDENANIEQQQKGTAAGSQFANARITSGVLRRRNNESSVSKPYGL
uniref:Movement protein n=1 Tax=Gongylonema pulchrum TaxID=637853 RepID=A0A183DLJ4_9BILA